MARAERRLRGEPGGERVIKRRNAARTRRLRNVIRYMLERGTLAPGHQVLLAAHFQLSRQRVNQLVALERSLLAQPDAAAGAAHSAKAEGSE